MKRMKSMNDFERFQKFFDENGVKYKTFKNAEWGYYITLDKADVDSVNAVEIDIRFSTDKTYETFEVSVYD